MKYNLEDKLFSISYSFTSSLNKIYINLEMLEFLSFGNLLVITLKYWVSIPSNLNKQYLSWQIIDSFKLLFRIERELFIVWLYPPNSVFVSILYFLFSFDLNWKTT